MKGFVVPNCRFFHTFENNILATVKNWWSLIYGQVYISIYLQFTSTMEDNFAGKSVCSLSYPGTWVR